MGVGYYELMGIRRTEFHRGLILNSLSPEDLSESPAWAEACFHAPFDHSILVPEVGYSDDRRFFAPSDEGLCRLLDVACHGCWAGGGTVNGAKLKVFKVSRVNGVLRLVHGTVDSPVGPLEYARTGLSLVGVPLLMGEHPTAAATKVLARLRAVQRGVHQLSPSYILVLRVVLLYAIAAMDPIYDAIPPDATRLKELQLVIDRTLCLSLRVPSNIPKVYLRAPLGSGGFGVPNLIFSLLCILRREFNGL